MTDYTASAKQFQAFLDAANSAREEICVLLVANLEDSRAEAGKSELVHLEDRYFSSRTVNRYAEALRGRGFRVEVVPNEHEFFQRIVTGDLQQHSRRPMVYNLTEAGTGAGGMSLIPAFCERYALLHCNSDPHGSSMGRHKFHSAQIMDYVGIPTPRTWGWKPDGGWILDRSPPQGIKVIVKSTFESYSVGVGPESVFIVDGSLNERVQTIAQDIGQQVVVQEFIAGEEVAAPVLEGEPPMVPPLVGIRLNPDKPLGDNLVEYGDELGSQSESRFNFAEGDHEVRKKISKLAVKAAHALGFSGYSRIDFRIDASGSPYVTDVGAVPVLYEGGSIEFSMRQWGFSLEDSLVGLIGATLRHT